MLEVVNSNNLETLADELSARLRSQNSSLFVRPQIAIPSSEIETWLSLAIAQRVGIAAQIDFVLPARLIWDLLQEAWPSAPAQSPFERSRLALRFLQQFLARPEELGDELRRYLADRSEQAQLAFAHRLAEQFDRYIVYRPEWIVEWESGADTHWQAELWRSVALDDHAVHWARVTTSQEVAKQLAQRLDSHQPIYFFAPAPLSPGYLNLLGAVASAVPVTMFLHNPCRAFWSDIADRKTMTRAGVSQPEILPYLEEGHRLLASLGAQLRGFVTQLQNLCDVDTDHFCDQPPSNLLRQIQADMLSLDQSEHPHLSGDSSIEIHQCHSRLREVEVLQDQLLSLLQADPQLHEHEIGVYVTDLAAYGSLINAVFGTAPDNRRLNVGAGQAGSETGLLTGKVIHLFDVLSGRIDAETISGLLDLPALRRRFSIGAAELDFVRRWIRISGARWGLDDAHVESFGATPHHNTWRWARRRLLGAYGLAASSAQVYEQVHVPQELDGAEADAIGGLLELLDAVSELHADIKQSRVVADWAVWFSGAVRRFMQPAEVEQWALQSLLDAVRRVIEDSSDAGLSTVIAWETFAALLKERLAAATGSSLYSNGISVLSLRPGSIVPFKVICVLGLNDGEFPRPEEHWDIDRSKSQRRLGDRSQREEANLMFLEVLTRAGNAVRLSFVGKDQHTDEHCPPAPCLAELMDYLERDLGVAESEFHRVHPLQPFSPKYDGESLVTFERLSVRPAVGDVQFAAETLPVAIPDSVELVTLLDFFRHPARYFLRHQLGVVLDDVHNELADLEPLTLDALDRWSLRERLLALTRAGADKSTLEGLVMSDPNLPSGPPGTGMGADLLEESQMLAGRASRWETGSDEIIPVSLDLGVRLRGTLSGFGPQGRTELRPGGLRMRQLLPKWIEHLVFNICGPDGYEKKSAWMTIDDHEPAWAWAPVDGATHHLQDLLEIYLTHQSRPLLFLPEASFVLETANKERTLAARKCWQGNAAEPWHEGNDPYNRLVFGPDPLADSDLVGDFKDLARRIYQPMISNNSAGAA